MQMVDNSIYDFLRYLYIFYLPTWDQENRVLLVLGLVSASLFPP